MLELKFIRENLALIKEKMGGRNIATRIDEFSAADQIRRYLLSELEALRNRRNTVSEEVFLLKKEKKDAEPLILEMREVGDRIKVLEKELALVEQDVQDIVMGIANIPHDSVPLGKDEHDNVEIRRWGEIPVFPFSIKAHWEIGENLGMLDFDRAAKISGARFCILKGLGARLERALINFMLDLHTNKHGYGKKEM